MSECHLLRSAMEFTMVLIETADEHLPQERRSYV